MKKELREQVIEHLEEDIKGVLGNLELARKSKDSNSSMRWVKCLEETIQVYNGLKETSLDEEVEKRLERILKLPQYREQLVLKEKIINSYGDKSGFVYECDMKKKRIEDFRKDFDIILYDKFEFLIDTSVYPRACGKTTLLKELLKVREDIIVFVPKSMRREYEDIKSSNLVFYDRYEDFRGMKRRSDNGLSPIICEEGYSIYDVLDMKYNHGLNIQCALVNGIN